MIVKDHACSGEEFTIAPVAPHQVLRTHPIPADLAAYYQEGYISHQETPSDFKERVYLFIKIMMTKRKLQWLDRWSGGHRSLLDYGAGSGTLVKAAREAGWRADGIEPSKTARGVAAKQGIELSESLEGVSGNTYQLISLWHVLEHVHDPIALLQDLRRHLSQDGLLIIAVPNHLSLDAEIYQSFWAAYDVPRHLWHFNRQTLGSVLAEAGLEVQQEKGLPLDAYYVSLLSEKFRHGRTRWLPAIWNGLRSNWAAGANGEYSSVVFVCKPRKEAV